MAANQAAMRTMLARIGFTVAASTVIVDEQGLDQLDEIKLLTERKGLAKDDGSHPRISALVSRRP